MPKVVKNPIDPQRNEKERIRNQNIQNLIQEIGNFMEMGNYPKKEILAAALMTLQNQKEMIENIQKENQRLNYLLCPEMSMPPQQMCFPVSSPPLCALGSPEEPIVLDDSQMNQNKRVLNVALPAQYAAPGTIPPFYLHAGNQAGGPLLYQEEIYVPESFTPQPPLPNGSRPSVSLSPQVEHEAPINWIPQGPQEINILNSPAPAQQGVLPFPHGEVVAVLNENIYHNVGQPIDIQEEIAPEAPQLPLLYDSVDDLFQNLQFSLYD